MSDTSTTGDVAPVETLVTADPLVTKEPVTESTVDPVPVTEVVADPAPVVEPTPVLPTLTPMQVEVSDLTTYEGLLSAYNAYAAISTAAAAKLEASKAVVVADEDALAKADAIRDAAKVALNASVDKVVVDADQLRVK